MLEKLKGYKKIHESYGSLRKVTMYNTTTRDKKCIITDDMEYEYQGGHTSTEYTGIELKKLWDMHIDEDALLQYKKDNGIMHIGAKIEVIKGRKYPRGTTGTVIKLYDYKDKYGRFIAEYCITDNNLKVDTKNVQIIL